MREPPQWVLWSVIGVAAGALVYFVWRGLSSPHVELGNVSEALGAMFTVAAVVAALRIAGRDRRDRVNERHEEETTRARLVRVDVTCETSRPAISASVRNYGPLPVLDLELIDVTHRAHPGAAWSRVPTSWRHQPVKRPILMPHDGGTEDTYATVAEFAVSLQDEETGRPLAEVDPRTAEHVHPSYLPMDVSDVVLTFRFRTPDGARWSVPTDGSGADEPVRL